MRVSLATLLFFFSLSLLSTPSHCEPIPPLSPEGLSLADAAAKDWAGFATAEWDGRDDLQVVAVGSIDTVTYKIAGGRRHTVVYTVAMVRGAPPQSDDGKTDEDIIDGGQSPSHSRALGDLRSLRRDTVTLRSVVWEPVSGALTFDSHAVVEDRDRGAKSAGKPTALDASNPSSSDPSSSSFSSSSSAAAAASVCEPDDLDCEQRVRIARLGTQKRKENDAEVGEGKKGTLAVVWSGRRLPSGERDLALFSDLLDVSARALSGGKFSSVQLLAPSGSLPKGFRVASGVAAIDAAVHLAFYPTDDTGDAIGDGYHLARPGGIAGAIDAVGESLFPAFRGVRGLLGGTDVSQGPVARRYFEKELSSGAYAAVLLDRFAHAAVDVASEQAFPTAQAANDTRETQQTQGGSKTTTTTTTTAATPAVVYAGPLAYGIDDPPAWIPAPLSGMRARDTDLITRLQHHPHLITLYIAQATKGHSLRKERRKRGLAQRGPVLTGDGNGALGVLRIAVGSARGFEYPRPSPHSVSFVGPLVPVAGGSPSSAVSEWLDRHGNGRNDRNDRNKNRWNGDGVVLVAFSDPAAVPRAIAAAVRGALVDRNVLWGTDLPSDCGPGPLGGTREGCRETSPKEPLGSAAWAQYPRHERPHPSFYPLASHPSVSVVLSDCDARIVQGSLAAGKPVVCVSMGSGTVDPETDHPGWMYGGPAQKDVAARLVSAGAGAEVRLDPSTPRAFRVPLAAVLGNDGEIDKFNEERKAPDGGFIETLAGTFVGGGKKKKGGKKSGGGASRATVSADYSRAAKRMKRITERNGDPYASIVALLADAIETERHPGDTRFLVDEGYASHGFMVRYGWEALAAWFLILTALSGAMTRCVGKMAHPVVDAGWEEKAREIERRAEKEKEGIELTPEEIAEKMKLFSERLDSIAAAEKTEKTD